MFLKQLCASSHSLSVSHRLCKRNFTSVTECMAVVYREHGDPNKVLDVSTEPLPPIGENDVAVKMLASPINPADINMIQGIYPSKPALPAVGGNEGVGEIQMIGDNVRNLKVGDWVSPMSPCWGTWRSYGVSGASDFVKIPKDLPVISSATLGVNVCTAYRMLKDFVQLQPGDVVIQNGANSGVGQAIIQLSAELGLQTINIVRNRSNIEELTTILENLGATHVVTDEYIRSPDMKTFMKSQQKPKLALNCVSGKAAAELLKHLGQKGVMVTYGGMSKQPLMVPAGPLIFSDISLKGYWMTEWNKQHSVDDPKRQDMWDTLRDMVRKGALKPPLCDLVPLENFKSAVSKSMEPFTTKKQILIMDEGVLNN